MAYSETINLVVGDTLPELTVTLRDSNKAATGKTLDAEDPTTWDPIDLSGATVRMRIRKVGTTTVASTLTMAIVGSASDGKHQQTFLQEPCQRPVCLRRKLRSNTPLVRSRQFMTC